MRTAVGIDIGGSSVKAALVLNGQVAATSTSDTYQSPTPARVHSAIQSALASLPLPANSATLPLGLCIPGLLTPDRTRIERSVNLPALQGIPIADLLDRPPTFLISDAVAAAADLQLGLSLPGRLFALALGTGVGAAVLDDAIPLRISGDGPGHFGQLDVSGGDPDAPLGPDGGRGSLEAYCGASHWPQSISPADCATQLRALAQALRIAHAIYRPQHIAILGGTALRIAPLRASLLHLVSTHLTGIARPVWQLHWASHAHHSAAGVARLAARAAITA
jgi:predicted NBD/HSP70 family sugar kinase